MVVLDALTDQLSALRRHVKPEHQALLAELSAARTELAVQLARSSADLAEATARIADLIGTGLKANEAVPAAVGILAAAPDAFSAIVAAANAGDDTDTVATIVGALAGAAAGAGAFPSELAATVDAVNGFDLAATARALADLR